MAAQPVLDRALAVATRHVPSARVALRRAARRSTSPAAPASLVAEPAASTEPGSHPPRSRLVEAAPVAAVRPLGPAPVVHVRTPAYGVRTVEARPGSEAAITVAARTADVIRLGFSAAVPSIGALARVTALVEDALAEAGRDRAEVRVLLDLEVVLADDERSARRKRSQLEYLDALAGLSWAPADTRVVTTAGRLLAEVVEVARRAGVDGVVLHPLAGGAAVEEELHALVA
ncbi:hypothetical protein [Cellulomonas sp. Marseille-Q8402]